MKNIDNNWGENEIQLPAYVNAKVTGHSSQILSSRNVFLSIFVHLLRQTELLKWFHFLQITCLKNWVWEKKKRTFLCMALTTQKFFTALLWDFMTSYFGQQHSGLWLWQINIVKTIIHHSNGSLILMCLFTRGAVIQQLLAALRSDEAFKITCKRLHEPLVRTCLNLQTLTESRRFINVSARACCEKLCKPSIYTETWIWSHIQYLCMFGVLHTVTGTQC